MIWKDRDEYWESKYDELRQSLKGAVGEIKNSIEYLADKEHDSWARWMTYLFSEGVLNKDGTFTMPKWAVDRWMLQSIWPYSKLSEEMKESDRKEIYHIVEKILNILEKHGLMEE